MRGTRGAAGDQDGKEGITPAHAGNTLSANPLSRACRDHPRPCGEHLILPYSPFIQLGSPPPMRGTHLKDPIKTLCQAIKFSEFIHFG